MQVYANDLNPKSYHYLTVNIKLNKASRLLLCMRFSETIQFAVVSKDNGKVL
jgi:tRNA G37 N-methylase Trm5